MTHGIQSRLEVGVVPYLVDCHYIQTQKKLVLVIEKFFSSNVVVQKVCDRPLVSSSQRKAA